MQNTGIHYIMVTFCVFACLHTHTHTHTAACIFVYMQA